LQIITARPQTTDVEQRGAIVDLNNTGRAWWSDGGRFQCQGDVDIADTPFAETIAACREVGYSLYVDAK
jgi:hypothetical protein